MIRGKNTQKVKKVGSECLKKLFNTDTDLLSVIGMHEVFYVSNIYWKKNDLKEYFSVKNSGSIQKRKQQNIK